MSFPKSYSFLDNFWGSKASNIEEVDFDFNYPFVEMNSYHNHPQPFQEGYFISFIIYIKNFFHSNFCEKSCTI